MKITVIEASAEELRSTQTLSEALFNALTNALTVYEEKNKADESEETE